jgi:cysteinyl-tRNA synthetase
LSTAMSAKSGNHFDIHGGGMDLNSASWMRNCSKQACTGQTPVIGYMPTCWLNGKKRNLLVIIFCQEKLLTGENTILSKAFSHRWPILYVTSALQKHSWFSDDAIVAAEKKDTNDWWKQCIH